MALLSLGVFTLYYRYITSTFDAFKNTHGVCGPKPYPALGTCGGLFSKGPAEYDCELINKYGKVVRIWFGRLHCLVVADVDVLQEVLIKQFHNFKNKKASSLDPPLDCMLGLLKDDRWAKVRHTVTPTFSAGKLRRMNAPIDECASVLINNITQTVEKGQAVDVLASLGGFTMDVIARTAFGIEVDSQSDQENPFVKMASKVVRAGFKSWVRIVMLIFPFLIPYMGKVGISLIPKDSVAFFVNIMKKTMEQRTGNQETLDARTDFLQLMVLCIGGYDTVANISTFALYELACNSEIQDKLIAEIDTCLRNNVKPSCDSVQKMSYLDMVLSETLRRYPPASRVTRLTNADTTINGIFIPKGAQVVIPINYLHHDPDIYHDPYKFDPERFSDQAKADRNPICNQPFGVGPRSCVAKRLALMEIKMAVVSILQQFTLGTCFETNMPIKRNKATGRPIDVMLTFMMRKSS